jgi:hypothetical protein
LCLLQIPAVNKFQKICITYLQSKKERAIIVKTKTMISRPYTRFVSLMICIMLIVGIMPAHATDAAYPYDGNASGILSIDDTFTESGSDKISVDDILPIAGVTHDPINTMNINSAIKVTTVQEMSNSLMSMAESGVVPFQESDGPMMQGVLPTKEDFAVYEVEINHSILPEVILYAFCYGATGDVSIDVKNSSGTTVARTSLVNRSIDTMARYFPKNFTSIKNSSGDIVTYEITVTSSTGYAAYGINLGTKETIVESFGGNNFTTVAKNVPSDTVAEVEMQSSIPGTAILLNTGEWFHYTADGDTFISATRTNCDDLAFFVLDPETGDILFATDDTNCGRLDDTGTQYLGYVTAGLRLESGKDYMICFYTTDPIEEIWNDYYFVYIGLPFMYSEAVDYCSRTSYSVSTGTTRTFKFNVTGLPASARAGQTTYVAFNTPNSRDNVCITSLIITAPNGKSYVADSLGRCHDFHYDSRDFFSAENVPISGTWTVKIRTSKDISGLQFKVFGSYKRVPGVLGD